MILHIPGERIICPSCKRTFTRIIGDEPQCGICLDPEGWEQFLKTHTDTDNGHEAQ